MSGLWQTIIGGLAVAALSGLTIIAYRHSTGYGRIYRPLLCILGAAWAAWFIYGLGFSSGFSEAALGSIKLNPGIVIKTPDHQAASFLYFMTPVILYAYLSFLRILPHVLNAKTPDLGGGEK